MIDSFLRKALYQLSLPRWRKVNRGAAPWGSVQEQSVGTGNGEFIPLIFAGLAVVVILAAWPRLFPFDDAYITLHNARSLLHAGDPIFHVSPLVGATSAVHLACIAAVGMLLPLPTASLLVGAVCTGLYAYGLWRLKRHWAVVAIGLLAGYVPVQLLNGLETSMALAAIVWAFVLADNKRLPLLLGLMPYIRPDLLFIAAPLAVRQMRHNPVRVVALSILAAGPFAMWSFLATGLPFPNTAGAKVAFFAEHAEPILTKVSKIFEALVMSSVVILAPGLIGLTRLKAGWCGLVYMTAVLCIALIWLPGSIFWNDFRYLAPFVPILCYGLSALSGRILIVIAAASALIGGIALSDLRSLLRGQASWFQAAAAVSKLPPGSTVMVHDIGVVAWANPHVRLVDVVGLKTPSSVETMKHSDVGPCRWGKALDQIARESRAQYVVVLQKPFWRCIGDNLRSAGWTLTPIAPGSLTLYHLTRS